MRLDMRVIKDTLMVKIDGDVDMLVAEQLRQEIDRVIRVKNIKNLILDMEGVTFMDSAGLGVVLGRYKKIAATGGNMYIVRAKPVVKNILELSGVNKLVTVCATEKEIINL
ncbi:MAG: anti-sigma F factor antagonist [Syntrophomonadaceae bacterium]|nr:anti-sigma F factor antagonist [Syntrophomonadaceae bacterium]